MIEVAFIRFYTSRVFITNLPFPRDTQLLLPFHRRPPWLQRDYTIKQNPGLRTEYLSMYQLNAIRHVGRVATWGSGRDPFNQNSNRSDGKSGPPQKVDPFFRNFSGWTKPIHWVLDRNFRKFWLNGLRPVPSDRWGGLGPVTINGPVRAGKAVAWVSGVSGGKGERWKRKRERAEGEKLFSPFPLPHLKSPLP